MDEKLFWSVGSELQIHFVWIRADSQNRPCPLYMELVLFSLKNNNNSSYCMGWLIIVTRFQLLCLLLAQVLCQLLLLFSHQVVPDSLQPHDCGTPGFPVLHYLPQFAQTHVHWVSDTIQSSHPLFPPSPPALNLSQNWGLFQWVNSSHQVAKVLELQLQHQSFQWIFRVGFLCIDWFDVFGVQRTLKSFLHSPHL